MLVLLVFICTASVAATTELELQNMLQQQASKLQALEARLTAVENSGRHVQGEVSSLASSVSDLWTNVTSINQQVRDVMLHAAKQVAFNAYMSRTHVHVGFTSPFVFDVLTTSLGDGYDNHTGVFTAPYAGLYVFHFVIVNDNKLPFIRAALVHGSRTLGVGTVDGGPENSYDDGSVTATAHLEKGDQVFVRRDGGANSVYGDVFCSFSGFMVMADLD